MDPPRPKNLPPPKPESLRISQEQELSATAFGRALLEATRASRASHYVVDEVPLKMWSCVICQSEFRVYGRDAVHPKDTQSVDLGPGHNHDLYCHHCFTSWVKAKLSDNCIEIRCLMDKCTTLLDQGQLSKALLKHWDNVRLHHCLAMMDDLRYCPACSTPAYLTPGCSDSECPNCNYQFCPTCMLPKHAAIRCSAAVYEADPEVQRKFYIERLSESWKVSHTKKCPSCQVAIEKNEGCSHMTCRRCKYEFCWICMQKYQGKYITGAAANGSKCPCPPLSPSPAPAPTPAPIPATSAPVPPAAAKQAPAAATPAAAGNTRP